MNILNYMLSSFCSPRLPKLINALALHIFLVGMVVRPAVLPAQTSAPQPVVIDFFFEPGCPECGRVTSEIFPELKAQYEGFYVLNHYDIGILSNFTRLVAYQKHFGISKNSSVSIFLDYSMPLSGFHEIKNKLLPEVERLAAERLAPEWAPPCPIDWNCDDAVRNARERAGSFTLPAVLLAGLIDGINPCAISTLVFFMSLLLISRTGRNAGLIMGISFCAASFITYTAIGFGMLRCLHMLQIFPSVRRAFELCMAAALLVLASLSLRDALMFHRAHNARKVSLQLPPPIKRLIHKLMREGLKSRHLIISGFVVGCLVTLLETVCTGQVYVPAMTLVIQETGGLRIWSLLILYNIMFITPLVTALILTRYGLSTDSMLRWSRNNVALSKTLLALFFLAVAVYLLV